MRALIPAVAVLAAVLLSPAVVVAPEATEPPRVQHPLTPIICKFETRAERDPDDAVSRAHHPALGRCQVKPDTARAVGYRGTNALLMTDSTTNRRIADRIIWRCSKRYRAARVGPRWTAAYLTAYCYHAGFRGVLNAKRRSRDYARNIALRVALRVLAR